MRNNNKNVIHNWLIKMSKYQEAGLSYKTLVPPTGNVFMEHLIGLPEKICSDKVKLFTNSSQVICLQVTQTLFYYLATTNRHRLKVKEVQVLVCKVDVVLES